MKTPIDPWYKHRWPWLLMAGPATVIVAGAITIWLAVVSSDGLVDDDYYKQGLTVNQRIHRDRVAAERGIEAEIMLGDAGKQLRAVLRSTSAEALPATVTLRLIHPTRAGLDQQVDLLSEGGGLYQGEVPVQVNGRWLVTLTDSAQQWRLTGEWTLQSEAPTNLVLGRR